MLSVIERTSFFVFTYSQPKQFLHALTNVRQSVALSLSKALCNNFTSNKELWIVIAIEPHSQQSLHSKFLLDSESVIMMGCDYVAVEQSQISFTVSVIGVLLTNVTRHTKFTFNAVENRAAYVHVYQGISQTKQSVDTSESNNYNNTKHTTTATNNMTQLTTTCCTWRFNIRTYLITM